MLKWIGDFEVRRDQPVQLQRQVRRVLVLLTGITLVAMMVGCNFLTNDSAKAPSIDLPAGITEEFRILFEVYSSLNAHHIDRDNLDSTTLILHKNSP